MNNLPGVFEAVLITLCIGGGFGGRITPSPISCLPLPPPPPLAPFPLSFSFSTAVGALGSIFSGWLGVDRNLGCPRFGTALIRLRRTVVDLEGTLGITLMGN